MDNESTSSADIFALHLKRPRVWNAMLLQLMLGFFIGAFVSLFMIYNKDGFLPPMFLVLFSGFIITLVVISITASILMRPKSDLKIEFHPDHIVLPFGSRFSKPKKIPYSDINSVVERGKKKLKYLIIGTKKRAFAYNQANFLEPVNCEKFLEILSRYLIAQPDGEKLWLNMKDRIDIFNNSMKPKIYATWIMFGVIAAVFIIEIALGVSGNKMILLELGANASVLVKEGQWFRLFNSNFLHLNFVHIYFNVFFLLFIGVGVERLAGIWNFIFIYLFSALGGAVASMIMQSALFSVGASTAMYGLFGALAVINIKYRGKLPVGYRIPIYNWILIILLTILMKFIFPGIDDAAHAGGFITGAFLAYLIYRNRNNPVISSKPVPVIKALTIVLVLLFLYSGFVSISQFEKGKTPGLIRLAELYDDIPDTSPGVLNNLAWSILTQKQENKEVIQFAFKLAERAVSQKPDEKEFKDTLATAHWLSGNSRKAVEFERKVLAMANKNQRFYATQLAFFAGKNVSTDHPVIFGEDKNPQVKVYSEWTGEGPERHLDIKADIGGEYKNVVVYSMQSRNGVNVGVSRFSVKNPQQKSYVYKTKIKDSDSDYRLTVLLVDTSDNPPEKFDRTWSYWFLDKKVSKIYDKIMKE